MIDVDPSLAWLSVSRLSLSTLHAVIMQPVDPHHHPHEHRAGPSHGIEHRDRVEYNDYATGGATHRHEHEAPLPPTSPNLSAFHRPTAQPDTVPLLPGLRRRTTQQAQEVLRIAVATPFNDHDRRKERNVPANWTVRTFKDRVASEEEGHWDRESMRLVWRGRIVRDDELLGGIIGEVSIVATERLCALMHSAKTARCKRSTSSPDA